MSIGAGGRFRFCEALISRESRWPREAQIFAPFIGGWDFCVHWYDEGGAVTREAAGEWFFSWVLEGRGVQDVWIVPPRARRGSDDCYEFGTSIRFYDPAIDAWRSTWVGPMHGVVHSFIARRSEIGVTLETGPGIAPALR